MEITDDWERASAIIDGNTSFEQIGSSFQAISPIDDHLNASPGTDFGNSSWAANFDDDFNPNASFGSPPPTKVEPPMVSAQKPTGKAYSSSDTPSQRMTGTRARTFNAEPRKSPNMQPSSHPGSMDLEHGFGSHDAHKKRPNVICRGLAKIYACYFGGTRIGRFVVWGFTFAICFALYTFTGGADVDMAKQWANSAGSVAASAATSASSWAASTANSFSAPAQGNEGVNVPADVHQTVLKLQGDLARVTEESNNARRQAEIADSEFRKASSEVGLLRKELAELRVAMGNSKGGGGVDVDSIKRLIDEHVQEHLGTVVQDHVKTHVGEHVAAHVERHTQKQFDQHGDYVAQELDKVYEILDHLKNSQEHLHERVNEHDRQWIGEQHSGHDINASSQIFNARNDDHVFQNEVPLSHVPLEEHVEVPMGNPTGVGDREQSYKNEIPLDQGPSPPVQKEEHFQNEIPLDSSLRGGSAQQSVDERVKYANEHPTQQEQHIKYANEPVAQAPQQEIKYANEPNVGGSPMSTVQYARDNIAGRNDVNYASPANARVQNNSTPEQQHNPADLMSEIAKSLGMNHGDLQNLMGGGEQKEDPLAPPRSGGKVDIGNLVNMLGQGDGQNHPLGQLFNNLGNPNNFNGNNGGSASPRATPVAGVPPPQVGNNFATNNFASSNSGNRGNDFYNGHAQGDSWAQKYGSMTQNGQPLPAF